MSEEIRRIEERINAREERINAREERMRTIENEIRREQERESLAVERESLAVEREWFAEYRRNFMPRGQSAYNEVEINIIDDRPEGFVARGSSKDPVSLDVFQEADEEDDIVILPCCKKVFLATPLHEWFETCLSNGGVSSINCPLCRTRMDTLDGFEMDEPRCIVTVYRAKKKRKVGGDKRKANERDSDYALDDDGNIIYGLKGTLTLRF